MTAAHTCSRQCNFEMRHACETYLPKIAFWSLACSVRRRSLRSWARLHVRLSRFACMMRLLSPAIVRKTRGRDCGQRLSRKGARPLSSALPHTVHQGIEATTPDETRVGNAKISTCTVVSISHFVGGPLRNQRRAPRGRSGGGTLSSASCASAGKRLDNRASFTRTRGGNRAKCSAIGNSWM